jgi:hypothetical protein
MESTSKRGQDISMLLERGTSARFGRISVREQDTLMLVVRGTPTCHGDDDLMGSKEAIHR